MLTRNHNVSPSIVFWTIVILWNISFFTCSAISSHPKVIWYAWGMLTGFIFLGCIIYEMLKPSKALLSKNDNSEFNDVLNHMRTARKFGISTYYAPIAGVTTDNRIAICINYAASFQGHSITGPRDRELDRLIGIVAKDGWDAGILSVDGNNHYLNILWHAQDLSKCLAGMPVNNNDSRGQVLNLEL